VGELPLLIECGADVRVELVCEIPWKIARADELHDVDEVLGSMGCRHAGCEFQLDELVEREHAIAGGLEAIGGWLRKAIGFGFPSLGKSPTRRKSIFTSAIVS
jgi:hypothetical protein